MTLILLSGRPGSGKTEVGKWLAENRGFIHIETDTYAGLATLNGLLGGFQCPGGAAVVHDRARALGEKVVIEWGFRPKTEFHFVRQLRLAGFDPWWLDRNEKAARQGYMEAKGDSAPMHLYWEQVNAIEAAWPKLEKFYGDHIIRTVSPGATALTVEQIASRMLPDDADG
ncbi:MAG TPA: hypothetical protein VME67_09565 [Mycobacterium sp.]|nr:hypothetical protein [Mycobacterium sp.]HTX95066.1 hypothetical protein [Mycobacterium sp.]